MGYYVTRNSKGEVLPTDDKFTALLEDGAEVPLEVPTVWRENLVCVVQNDWGQAAAYCYNEREFRRFSMEREDDKRIKVWVTYKHAKILSGYQEYLNQTDDLPID